MSLRELIIERIRTRGPLTFAEYMDLALYHPELGYYARADRPSGRAGNFFTSVDVGPLFGELLAVQFAEMWHILGSRNTETGGGGTPSVVSHPATGVGDGRLAAVFDLVEAGAGRGQLSRDILDAVAASDPHFYRAIRLHLVECSAAARAAQPATLGPHGGKLAASSGSLPDGTCGVIFANELLDALPTHIVVMTRAGLQEIFVHAQDNQLTEGAGPLSSPHIAAYLDRLGVHLEPGWRVEVNLAAVSWVHEAARRLHRGFLVIVDYGHEAGRLYSPLHATGTLATYRGHTMDSVPGARQETGGGTPWLAEPGDRDITSHVDLTSIRQAAEDEGLRLLGLLDQTYFLLGLGAADRLAGDASATVADLKRRLAMKTLLLPGGLGSTHKVLILGKRVGTPPLRGCSYRVRTT